MKPFGAVFAVDNEDLDEQELRLQGEIADIKAQIEGAKARAAQTGDYSDNDWFIRANHALRHRTIEHQKVLKMIGERNRERRKKNGEQSQRRFIELCRKRLPPETFQMLWEEFADGEKVNG